MQEFYVEALNFPDSGDAGEDALDCVWLALIVLLSW